MHVCSPSGFDTPGPNTYNEAILKSTERNVVDKSKPHVHRRDATPSLEDLAQQLTVLDERLDNIDSIVTNVAERVMSQPITISVTCAGCGRVSTYNLLASEKPTIVRK